MTTDRPEWKPGNCPRCGQALSSPDRRDAASFIEFAPHHKTVNPKPAAGNPTFGTFWYAEGWIGGKRFEFATAKSQSDAEWLCSKLNTIAEAVLEALSVESPSLTMGGD